MSESLRAVSKDANAYGHVLILFRHAQAEPAGLTGDDIARPLTDKGKNQAKRVAKGLVAAKLVPQSIVCSGAVRTRQTVERLLKVFGDGPTVAYRQDLYDKGQAAIMAELARAGTSSRRLMVVGHEPTISLVAGLLARRDSDQGLLDLLRVGVSNASTVILGSDLPFNEWLEHSAELVAVLSPNDFD